MAKELRKTPRADISLRVEVVKKGGKGGEGARGVNISESGAFIETKMPAEVGEEMDLIIFLDNKELKVFPHAKVVYSTSEGGRSEKDLKSLDEMRKWLSGKMRDGWGVRFTNISESDEKLLHAFVIALKD